MAKRAINYVVCSNCLNVFDGNDMCIIKREGHNTYYCEKCEEKTRKTNLNLGLIRGPKLKKSRVKKNI